VPRTVPNCPLWLSFPEIDRVVPKIEIVMLMDDPL
jgi:hypothetical protein